MSSEWEATNQLRWLDITGGNVLGQKLQQRWCLDAGVGYAKAYQWRDVPTIKQES